MPFPELLYDNRLLDGTITASSTATGYDARNLTDLRAFTYWRSASGTPHTLTIDCGSAKSADTLAVALHNLFSRSASVEVRGSTDNFAASNVSVMAAFTPASDNLIYQHFTATSFRYWRIIFTGLDVFVAIAVLGTRFTFDAQIEGEYIPAVDRPKNVIEITRNGDVTASTTMVRSLECGLRLGFMLDSSFRTTFKAAWDAHLSLCKPFFFAPDYTNNPRDVFFYRVKPGAEIQTGYNMQNMRAVVLPMVGIESFGGGLASTDVPVATPGPFALVDAVPVTSSYTSGLRSVVWAGNKFVVGGFAATATTTALFISNSTATAWTDNTFTSPRNYTDIYSMAYSGSEICAVNRHTIGAAPYTVSRTTDGGVTWTETLVPTPDVYLGSVAYGAGIFCTFGGLGGSGDSHVHTSATGGSGTWTDQSTAILVITGGSFNGGVFGGSKWVGVGQAQVGISFIAYASSAANNWAAASQPTPASGAVDNSLFRVAYSGTVYCAVGSQLNGAGPAQIWTSTDGITWTQNITHGLLGEGWGVVYGSGKFYLIGFSATTPYIVSSSDGVTWATETIPSSIDVRLTDVAYSPTNSQLCVVGDYSATLGKNVCLVKNL